MSKPPSRELSSPPTEPADWEVWCKAEPGPVNPWIAGKFKTAFAARMHVAVQTHKDPLTLRARLKGST